MCRIDYMSQAARGEPLECPFKISNLLKNKKPLDTVKTAYVYEYSKKSPS